MSAGSVAYWNAIPLSRTDSPAPLKRPRQEDDADDDDDDDDISLISRSPSPVQPMDVDSDHIHKYDEYVRGVAREVITVETKIKPTNKGFAMLAKLGWTEGQPLGLSGDGRVDPVSFQIKRDSTGLGKATQDFRMIETTVSQRRELDSERQQKETEDQRQARAELVARKAALEDEISSTLKAFYCTLCDKQFKNVAQYDEHTNSYAHHHKARFKDMQASVRQQPKEEIDKRKEKERKREERELRKIAAASGIKLPKPVSSTPTVAPSVNSNTYPDSASQPRKGWATVSAPQEVTAKKSGWASLGTSSSSTSMGIGAEAVVVPPSNSLPLPPSPSHVPPPPPPPEIAPPPPPPDVAPPTPSHPPGWSALAPARPQPSTAKAAQPLNSQPVRSGWQQFKSSGHKR